MALLKVSSHLRQQKSVPGSHVLAKVLIGKHGNRVTYDVIFF